MYSPASKIDSIAVCIKCICVLFILSFVGKEFKGALPDQKIFKLIGRALFENTRAEATENVSKRLSFISGEIKKIESAIKDFEKSQDLKEQQVTNPAHVHARRKRTFVCVTRLPCCVYFCPEIILCS